MVQDFVHPQYLYVPMLRLCFRLTCDTTAWDPREATARLARSVNRSTVLCQAATPADLMSEVERMLSFYLLKKNMFPPLLVLKKNYH